jgi:long-subunit acyl-CoA synthetase (AMP-forming)
MAIVSTTVQLEKILAAAPTLPDLRTIVITRPDSAAERPAGPVSFTRWTRSLARGHGAIKGGWGVGREFHDRAKRMQPADPATIVYTSGTTGEPKA